MPEHETGARSPEVVNLRIGDPPEHQYPDQDQGRRGGEARRHEPGRSAALKNCSHAHARKKCLETVIFWGTERRTNVPVRHDVLGSVDSYLIHWAIKARGMHGWHYALSLTL